MKKIESIRLLLLCITTFSYNFIKSTTQITSTFKNSTDIPVTLQTFRDNNQRAIETQNIKPGKTYTSKISTEQTVSYTVQHNIKPFSLSIPFLFAAPYNISYDNFQATFILLKSSYTDPYPEYQNANVAVTQLTNITQYPINIFVKFNDYGQATKYGPDQSQTDNTTQLLPNAYYTSSDKLETLIISSAITNNSIGPVLASNVKKKYTITYKNGGLLLTTSN